MTAGPSLRILIVDDEKTIRRFLRATLSSHGYTVFEAETGEEALEEAVAKHPDAIVLDLGLPGMDGTEVTRRIRKRAKTPIIILSVREDESDKVAALDAGADDYLTKPYNRDELRVRLNAGVRIIELQTRLAERVRELEAALDRVKQLEGILSICSYCKKVRDDQDYWQSVESYVSTHSEAHFSHGICPSCYDTTVKPNLNHLYSLSVRSSRKSVFAPWSA
jgi:CheY-like chemotaxis protein